MLSALLSKAFNNGSGGFAISSSHLDVCLLLGGLLSRRWLVPRITPPGFVLQKLDSNSEASFSSFHFDFAQEIPITGLRDWLVEMLGRTPPAPRVGPSQAFRVNLMEPFLAFPHRSVFKYRTFVFTVFVDLVVAHI